MPIATSYIDIDDKQTTGKYNEESSTSKSDDVTSIESSISSSTTLCMQHEKCASNFISIFDGVLSDEWCDFAYQYALQRLCKPWGVYITTTDVLDTALDTNTLRIDHPERAIALEATRALLFGRARGIIGHDISIIHGTAVWCLASGLTNSVEYHIDYAELYRYENNIIVPPLYGATCHISHLADDEMAGGDFCINSRGLSHYLEYGYKGRLAKDADALIKDLASSDWMKIRYKYNRGTVFDGDMPHLASPITSLAHDKKRVILGFNCFTDQVAECNMRAPEHSDAFNRTIRLYQTMKNLSKVKVDISSSTSIDSNSHSKARLTAKDLMKKPALARLLVMAAKKVKQHQLDVNRETSDCSCSGMHIPHISA